VTDLQFKNELNIRCFIDQIAAFPVGDLSRVGFKPVVPINFRADGSIDREQTLALPAFRLFSIRERATLLAVD